MVKFERSQITSMPHEGKSTSVPDMITFMHILKNAKKGNEMALVILDEWNRFCRPENAEEKLMTDLIRDAVDKLFR